MPIAMAYRQQICWLSSSHSFVRTSVTVHTRGFVRNRQRRQVDEVLRFSCFPFRRPCTFGQGFLIRHDKIDVTHSNFFFSSRRRHTSWPRDWSSDVCSSDLRFAELSGFT